MTLPPPPRRGRSLVLAVLVAALVVAVAGCSGAAGPTSPTPAPATATPDAPTAAAEPPPDPPTPSPTIPSPGGPSTGPTDDAGTGGVPGPGPEEQLPACDDARRDELEDVVGAQLDAFAAGDFAAARELASTTFRSGIDVAAFEELIVREYPAVLDGGEPGWGRCLSTAEQGALEVELAGPDGDVTLVYLLVREDDRWRIDGAQYGDPPDEGIET